LTSNDELVVDESTRGLPLRPENEAAVQRRDDTDYLDAHRAAEPEDVRSAIADREHGRSPRE
jgi:hypothetical protein